MQLQTVADNLFVIVSLPHLCTRCGSNIVDTFGRHGFERPDQTPQRFAFRRCRGGSQTAPTGTAPTGTARTVRDNYDAVYVVRHYDPLIQMDVRISFCQPHPTIRDFPSVFVHLHVAVYYRPEETHPILGADSDQIRAVPRIVVAVQADRPAVVLLHIPHRTPLSARALRRDRDGLRRGGTRGALTRSVTPTGPRAKDPAWPPLQPVRRRPRPPSTSCRHLLSLRRSRRRAWYRRAVGRGARRSRDLP